MFRSRWAMVNPSPIRSTAPACDTNAPALTATSPSVATPVTIVTNVHDRVPADAVPDRRPDRSERLYKSPLAVSPCSPRVRSAINKT